MTAAERFQDHLDVCARCERHPFDLCPRGALLLQQAAVEVLPLPVPPEALQ